MSTPKHTPGPWHVGLKPGPMVYGPQGEQIVGLNVMLDSDEVLANAKFIAAAPAMYEALKFLTSEIDLSKLNVRKDFSLMNAHAWAIKVILQAEGKLL